MRPAELHQCNMNSETITRNESQNHRSNFQRTVKLGKCFRRQQGTASLCWYSLKHLRAALQGHPGHGPSGPVACLQPWELLFGEGMAAPLPLVTVPLGAHMPGAAASGMENKRRSAHVFYCPFTE